MTYPTPCVLLLFLQVVYVEMGTYHVQWLIESSLGCWFCCGNNDKLVSLGAYHCVCVSWMSLDFDCQLQFKMQSPCVVWTTQWAYCKLYMMQLVWPLPVGDNHLVSTSVTKLTLTLVTPKHHLCSTKCILLVQLFLSLKPCQSMCWVGLLIFNTTAAYKNVWWYIKPISEIWGVGSSLPKETLGFHQKVCAQ